jgi:Tfp pilus assembly protein PilZ
MDSYSNSHPKYLLTIQDIDSLHSAYLPITSYGALFVKTDNILPLESPVVLDLQINIPEKDIQVSQEVPAAVCWLNLSKVKNRPKGMCLRFTDKEDNEINKLILLALGKTLESNKLTFMF